MKKTKKIALTACFCTLAFAFSYMELLLPLPAQGIPGIKLGLANIAVMMALYLLGLPYAAMVSAVRILLSLILFGSVPSCLYSLAGGTLSLIVMTLMKKSGAFDPIGVSIGGGVCHNMAQMLVAMALFGAPGLLYYVPVLLITGAVTGLGNGIVVKLLCTRLPGRHESEFMDKNG